MSESRAVPSGCHRGIDAGAYVLRALSDEESRFYVTHLAECDHCRAEVDDLRLVVDTLPIAAPQTPPPAALRRRIMAVVDAESELLLAAGPAADRLSAPRRRAAAGCPPPLPTRGAPRSPARWLARCSVWALSEA